MEITNLNLHPPKIMKTKKILIVFVGYSMAVTVRNKGHAEVPVTPIVPVVPPFPVAPKRNPSHCAN